MIWKTPQRKAKGNKWCPLKKWPIIWGHSHVYLGKKHMWPDAWWEMKRYCWGRKEGAVVKSYPPGPPWRSTYRESLTSHSFHFMAQTPDHKSFTSSTTETVPGPERLPHKGPHSLLTDSCLLSSMFIASRGTWSVCDTKHDQHMISHMINAW